MRSRFVLTLFNNWQRMQQHPNLLVDANRRDNVRTPLSAKPSILSLFRTNPDSFAFNMDNNALRENVVSRHT
jgi:hypothetical protein